MALQYTVLRAGLGCAVVNRSGTCQQAHNVSALQSPLLRGARVPVGLTRPCCCATHESRWSNGAGACDRASERTRACRERCLLRCLPSESAARKAPRVACRGMNSFTRLANLASTSVWVRTSDKQQKTQQQQLCPTDSTVDIRTSCSPTPVCTVQ